MALGIYRAVTDAEVSRSSILMAWGIITLVIILWCVLRDPHVLTWTLTETDVRRGKNQDDLVIPFDDIESIVLGLPPRLPWFFRIARFHPRSRGAYRNLVVLRSTAFLLRLRGGRIMPLNFMTAQYQNGQAFMEAFLPTQTARSIRCRIVFLFRQSIVSEQSPSCARLSGGLRVLDMGLHTNKSPNHALQRTRPSR